MSDVDVEPPRPVRRGTLPAAMAGERPGDAAARERAIDPTRSFIVQAPAGSGKTELLTQRYLRLLATVQHPEEVLAITFTRKAAAEMRNRILKALADAADETPPREAHKRGTWELARAVRAADREHGWHLTLHPARLRIQTIDALSGQLARRLPVLSGAGAPLEPTHDPQPLYEEACLRLIESLGDGSAAARKLETLIAHLANRVDKLITLLTDLLGKRDQWLHHVMAARASPDLRTAVEHALQAVIGAHLQEVCRHIAPSLRGELWTLTRYAAANLVAQDGLDARRAALLEVALDAPGEALWGPEDAPGAVTADLAKWRAVCEVFLNRDGVLYRRLSKTQGFPASDAPMATRAKEALAALAATPQLGALLAELRTLPSPSYRDEQWTVLEALLEVLPMAVVQLQDVFQARGEADYVECALRALAALGSPDEPTDLALAFDYRLRHILVDEFQDTSFTQLDLLERLTAGWMPGDGRTLFCVGDPMQSIYRFRQAEVGLFLELQRRGLGQIRLEPLRLEANFRSAPALVEWVNQALPGVLAERNDAEKGGVAFSASHAANPAMRVQPAGVHVHAAIDTTHADEARQVLELTRQALARDPQATVAILVASRRHIGSIAGELERAGIEFQAVEIERLIERPVVQDLIALTRALVHLADRPAWLAVLRAPWCGLRLEDLHALAAERFDRTVFELLADEALFEQLSADGRARVARVRPVLEAALAERARHALRDWVERTWNALAGPATLASPQDLSDAQAFFARLEELEHGGDLEDVTRLETQLQDLFARPRPGHSARVELMTIHKAKGLEFDTVILPGLERGVRGEERALLRWTRVAGLDSNGLVLAPVTAEGEAPEQTYRWLELLETRRSEYERGRLLYVAVTRAKRELHLLGRVRSKLTPNGLELRKPPSGSMLRMLWQAVAPEFEAALRTLQPRQEALRFEEAAAMPLRRLPLEWQPPGADAALDWAASVAPAGADAERPEFDWVSETGRHVGTLVHRELDRLTRLGVADRYDPTQHRARLLAELAELGVPPERCAAACERAVRALVRTLEDPLGRRLLGLEGALTEVESELALTGLVDGRLRDVVIDRTFVDEQGTRWIVDFKTSMHEGGGLETFLDDEVHRYRPQLMRYAQLMRMYRPGQPVRAALYFPLLGAMREVPV